MVGQLHIARVALSIHFFFLLVNFSCAEIIRPLAKNADWMERDTKVKATMLLIMIITMFPAMVISAVYRCYPNFYTAEHDTHIIIGAVLTVILVLRANYLRWKKVDTKLANFIKAMSYIFPIVVFIEQVIMYRGEI